MRRKPRVLFAAFEAAPFIKTGGLGDVAGSLPSALQKAGCEVRVMLPKLDVIPEEYCAAMTHLREFRVQLGWRNLYCGLEMLQHNGITYYFLDNEYYFKRSSVYGYFDDGERMAFFSKAVAESLGRMTDFSCDVVHCNDWHTALVPVFLREQYRGSALYDNVRTVFTVHNLKFQGRMSDAVLGDVLGLEDVPAAASQLRFEDGAVNFLQGALHYSDLLTTVSPTYAREIRTDFYGEQMDGIFRQREDVLFGILNGIDTASYHPETDDALPCHFSAADLSGKAACKAALQRELGLEEATDVPLAVIVGRLTEQKGLDLVQRVLNELLACPVQLAVLGTGESRFEEMLRRAAESNPGRLAVRIRFDEAMSRRLYAGGDLLLMPSLFEPCGLSQMIAMRYGTLPVVRETGGLLDSVEPYNQYTGEGTGFRFANFNAHELLYTVETAAVLYRDEPDRWRALQSHAMAEDFSWDRAAEAYLALYLRLHPEITPWRKTAPEQASPETEDASEKSARAMGRCKQAPEKPESGRKKLKKAVEKSAKPAPGSKKPENPAET